jgi:chromosome partitioning protein
MGQTNKAKKTLGDLINTSLRGKAALMTARDVMLAPDSQKIAPLFTVNDLASLTGVNKATIYKTLKAGIHDDQGKALPRGRIAVMKEFIPFESLEFAPMSGNERRFFTCDEFAQLTRHFAPQLVKPRNGKGAVVAVCNYKGGVSKTVSAVCIAQALASRGKRVLCIDLDPQGSMTNLFNFLHYSDVKAEDTALDLFLGKSTTLSQCVRETYWPNINLIPASSALQGSEFAFRQLIEEVGFESVSLLNNAIDMLMGDYDVCVIDTPPSLNSLTNAALFAADGVIMPIPASNLELNSAVQFWDMYAQICLKMDGITKESEVFSFVKIIIPKMENTISCRTVMQWINDIYGEDVSKFTIPKSTAVSRANDSFGTVFDVLHDSTKKVLDSQRPVKEAYESIAKEIETELFSIWAEKTPA